MSPVAKQWHNIHLSATAVTLRYNKRTVGTGVPCWVRPKTISRGPTEQTDGNYNSDHSNQAY
jgi:hypothetical protein